MGFFSGAIVDRNRPEAVAKITTGLSAVCAGLIALLIDIRECLPIVYLLLFVNSSLSAIQLPAFQSLVVRACPRHKLLKGNSNLGIVDQTNSVFVPLFVGFAFTFVPPVAIFLISAASYLGSLFVLLPMHIKQQRLHLDITTWKAIGDGFSVLFSNRELFSSNVVFIFSNFATTLVQSTVVAMLAVQFGNESYSIGVFFAAVGLFGIAGHSLARFIVCHFPVSSLIMGLTVVSAALTILMVLNPSFTSFTVLWGMTVLLGAINVTALTTYRQTSVPEHVMGRAVSASRVMTYFPIPIGAALAGVIFEMMGSDAVVMISAGARVLGVIAAGITLLYLGSRRNA